MEWVGVDYGVDVSLMDCVGLLLCEDGIVVKLLVMCVLQFFFCVGVVYEVYEYEFDLGVEEVMYGEQVVVVLGKELEWFYKILVVELQILDWFEFIIVIVFVLGWFDFKVLVCVVGVKKVEMVDLMVVEWLIGYVMGGISFFG